MIAKDVPLGEWFMLLRTKQWFKAIRKGRKYIYATQIGVFSEFKFELTEEVSTRINSI